MILQCFSCNTDPGVSENLGFPAIKMTHSKPAGLIWQNAFSRTAGVEPLGSHTSWWSITNQMCTLRIQIKSPNVGLDDKPWNVTEFIARWLHQSSPKHQKIFHTKDFYVQHIKLIHGGVLPQLIFVCCNKFVECVNKRRHNQKVREIYRTLPVTIAIPDFRPCFVTLQCEPHTHTHTQHTHIYGNGRRSPGIDLQ